MYCMYAKYPLFAEDIRNIAKLDFTNFSIGSNHLHSAVMKLSKNPNNSQFQKSIEILNGFTDFHYSSLGGKFEFPFLVPNQDVINIFYDEVLPAIPQGVFKGIIAVFILKSTKSKEISKSKLASLALQNYILDIPEIFKGKCWNENFIYLALDIAMKFKMLEQDRKCLNSAIKKEFNETWNKNKINGFHLRIYRTIIEQYDVWNKEEHRKNLVVFLRNAKYYYQDIVDENSYLQHILCAELIKYVIDNLEKMKKNQFLKTHLIQKLIEHCLIYCDKTSVQTGIGILQDIRNFSQVKRVKEEVIEQIDRKLMSFNRKLQENFMPMKFPIDQEHIESLERQEANIKNDIVRHKMSLDKILQKYIWELSIRLDDLKNRQPTFVDYLQTIYLDENGRRTRRHEAGSIFQNYALYVRIYSFDCAILMEKILEYFYPQTFDFRDLVLYNPIVPDGYGEMICRALYSGVQKENMDFLIYCTYSFEAILRHILVSNGHLAIKTNQQERQDYKTFENMLKDIERHNLLKPDLIEELRLIFTDKGFNLRNDVAHATLSIYNFYGYYHLRSYLWCFLVRFLILGLNGELREEVENNE